MTDKKAVAELTDEWYAFFMEFSETFRNLSMDMQGEMCIDAVNYELNYAEKK